MANHEEEHLTSPHLDMAARVSEQHPLARAVAEATGLPTIVVEGHSGSPGAGAERAARVALAHFRPMRAARGAEATIEHIDEVLGENTVRGDE
jgi:hypothetical protein